jgi:hypothetical protein
VVNDAPEISSGKPALARFDSRREDDAGLGPRSKTGSLQSPLEQVLEQHAKRISIFLLRGNGTCGPNGDACAKT